MNPIEEYLSEKLVSLPTEAIDFSSAFNSATVQKGYVIVMTGRSGSTWLASSLQQLSGFGRPEEFFSEPILHFFWPCETPQSFSDVFIGIVNKYADHGCFGFKINPQRLFWLGKLVDLEKSFSTSFFSWIDMRRWNLVKQGLSYTVAKKSSVWHHFSNDLKNRSNDETAVDFSDADIWAEILAILQQEQTMDKFYSSSGISPLRIFYEELFDSKTTLLTRTCSFIRSDMSVNAHLVADGTLKLDKAQYRQRELTFTETYAGILNRIYSERSSISLEQISNLVPTR